MFRYLLLLSVCFVLASSVPVDDDFDKITLAKTLQQLLENERLSREERKNLMAQQIFENFEKQNKLQNEDNLDKTPLNFSEAEEELIEKNQKLLFDVNEDETKKDNQVDLEWQKYLSAKIKTPIERASPAPIESLVEETTEEPVHVHLDVKNEEIFERTLHELSCMFRHFDKLIESEPFKVVRALLVEPFVIEIKQGLIALVRNENEIRFHAVHHTNVIKEEINAALLSLHYFAKEVERDVGNFFKNIFH